MRAGDESSGTLGSTTLSYERIASAYATSHVDEVGEHIARTRGRFADGLHVGATVADVGCGPGRDLRWFAERGLSPIGVDASLEMLRLPTQRGRARVRADLRRLPFTAESLHGVWCASALLHVPREEASDVLLGFRRALRTGGRLGVITPIGEAEGWELVPYDTTAQTYDHQVRRWFAYFQPSELAGMLASARFRIEHEETVQRFKPWWHAVLVAV